MGLAMRSKGPTEFQERVYATVRRIPTGTVASYAVVANAIDCRSPRAVGQAMRLCPYDDVPCHRVVAAGGRLGGFGGNDFGKVLQRKKQLLLAEGVAFRPNGQITEEHILPDSPGVRRLLRG